MLQEVFPGWQVEMVPLGREILLGDCRQHASDSGNACHGDFISMPRDAQFMTLQVAAMCTVLHANSRLWWLRAREAPSAAVCPTRA